MFDDIDLKLILSLVNWAWESGGVSGQGAKERAQALMMLESKCRSVMQARPAHAPHNGIPDKPNGTEKKPQGGSILTEEPVAVGPL